MTIDELRAWLRLWGRHYGERVSDFDDTERDAPDVHPLAVARNFAPGTRARAALAARRDGSSRRRHMARDLAACGIRVVPVAYVDAVPGTTSSRGGGYVTAPPPVTVVAIQAAVMGMVEDTPEWGLALQAQYGVRGALSDKAEWVEKRLGRGVPVRAFRALVEQATYVLLGRLAS